MTDSPSLLNFLTEAIDHYVVPAIMLWFIGRWFSLLPDVENSGARKATLRGAEAGIAGALGGSIKTED